MEIEVKNCNNIDNGVFHIEEGKLNIEYAINGTGKSTLAAAIKYKDSDELQKLRPFKYLNDNENIHNPVVQFQNIKNNDIERTVIFDENYINTYVFKKGDELLENSFEIFVKTPNYDKHMEEINNLLESITNVFKQDSELDDLVIDLEKFINSFGKPTKQGYSRSGTLLKSLGDGNKLEDIPKDLKLYTPYLTSKNASSKWLHWQAEGKNYLDLGDRCPYCVSKITTPKEVILKVQDTYNVKYLKDLDEILDVFKSLSHYFTNDVQNLVNNIVINISGIADEQMGYLVTLKNTAELLKNKLVDLKSLSFSTFKDIALDELNENLNKKKIDLNYFPGMDSEYTRNKIENLNSSLNMIINKARLLKREIAQQKGEIAKTIEKNEKGINAFLKTAGYTYTVSLERDKNDNYKLILKFGQNNTINEVKNHLSYGERNAFALVLFMYQALKEDAKFIILDDPISSFDGNKKYAILDMLFRRKESFQEKTVLMLTHDFEPIIDTIYNVPQYFQPTPVAHFLENINGIIKEVDIIKKDIQSCIEICKENIQQSKYDIHKIIYLRRYLEIMGNKGAAWQITSNAIHGRSLDDCNWKDNSGNKINISSEELKMGEEEISTILGKNFTYEEFYNNEIKDRNNLIQIYNSCKSGYEKVQIYRILFGNSLKKGSVLKKYIDETFHVQNDYLYQLNPRCYKIVPQYILDFCDSEVNEEV